MCFAELLTMVENDLNETVEMLGIFENSGLAETEAENPFSVNQEWKICMYELHTVDKFIG